VAKLAVFYSASPAARGAADLDTLIRSILFIAAFWSVWISFHPFPSLAEPPRVVTEGGDLTNQIAFSLMFLAFAAWACFHEPHRLLLLMRPSFIAVLCWCVVSVFMSWEPELSARRLIFTLVLLSISGIVLLLPKSIRHFSDLLATIVIFVLALSYLGLLVMPQLSIHQATDLVEFEHAGEWRGVFTHKNYAGVTMVIFIFIGMFVARVRSLLLGSSIVIASAVFLAFTESKNSIGMLPITLLLCMLINRTRSHALGVTIVVGVFVAFNLLTVGSVYFEPIRRLVDAVMVDPSFTGRTDLWQFGLEYLQQRPIFGYGFSAFWGTQQVVYDLGENLSWVNSASDAHNAYLNLALTIGIGGLMLVILWIVVMPVLDFYRGAADPNVQALRLLFLRILLFCVYSSCFENSIFQQLDSVWFPFSMAAFGLRYLAVGRLVT